jgi:drug/metabolite transporter (DMT)-like permease
VARACADVRADRGLRWSLLAALVATGIIYLGLPGIGLLIFGEHVRAALALGGAAICAGVLAVLMRRMGWESVVR